MTKLNRLFDLANQALGKTQPSASGDPGANPGGTEWKTTLQQAADSLTGKRTPSTTPPPPPGTPASSAAPSPAQGRRDPLTPPPVGQDTNRDAVARYEYLLRTAAPGQLEQIHQDAFARLTPAERENLAARMRTELPPAEQPRSAGPADLARAATRTEISRPGALAPLLARATPALAGTAVAGGVLVAVAGGAVLSTVAAPLLLDAVTAGVDFGSLAETVNLGEIAAVGGELAAGASDTVSGAADAVIGLGDHVAGISDHLSGIGIPGLGDIFGR